MSWVSLTIEVNAVHVEILSDTLFELGALSVDIHDAAAGTEQEQPLFDEPGELTGEIWAKTEVTALFEQNADIPIIMQMVTEALQLATQPEYRLSRLEEQDWVKLTQAQFDPIKISSRLWIVPTWHHPPDPTAINLILDPGRAFGTGSHPTTQLCLSWLDRNVLSGETVLDYGCGSGILAIAALKLGASNVLGIDIDANAIEASRDNAVLNRCDPERILFSTTLDLSRTNTKEHRLIDKVVANILANPLIMLAPILMNALRKGGYIALSGILKEQAGEVIDTYRQWFEMDIADKKEDWVLLTGIKK
ncbi:MULTISPECIES: 50S ribosomal protein L11 methyltransferase [unclassified Nitrosomonas]|uniref:50S ribosomal protein L11 methyltransferase n=1 Tax=unclassified Nitrosomonas TaxID=2609265 RepID=UPI00089A023D|nr:MULTISPECIES: 50S ribosomal protein L11 methyltransferase [unclassified Nitrosomonas]MDV6345574.1 50S ribosomal protein L11 methyltransferase [Nitrosomonas sp. Is37]SDY77088.1 ribosomal protein L11 methyltransferase [Nitrosomonas sp. Nm33]